VSESVAAALEGGLAVSDERVWLVDLFNEIADGVADVFAVVEHK
jgi:hypothetical protein